MDDVLALAYEVSRVTEEKVGVIDAVMRQTRILSLNARLEAARSGDQGRAFLVVAQEMATLADSVRTLSTELKDAIAANIVRLEGAGRQMQLNLRGARYADMAHTIVEIVDRNLYERSCDVRWWATDAAIVAAPIDPAARGLARQRLATILRSYTVYLDLWVADAEGRIVATGRGARYPAATGADVSGQAWFRKAMATRSGADFIVCDVNRQPLLGDAATATYAAAIRRDGDSDGAAIGALGIFFDWTPQAAAVVGGVVAAGGEGNGSINRAMLLDADCRVIAASDGRGLLEEIYPLRTDGQTAGYYADGGRLIAFARTPGYETYRGLGWYGCIEQKL